MNGTSRNAESQGDTTHISASNKQNTDFYWLETDDSVINAKLAELRNISNSLQGGIVDVLNRAQTDIAANDSVARFNNITQEFVQKVA